MKTQDVSKRVKNNKYNKITKRMIYVIIIIIFYNVLMVGISSVLSKGTTIFGYKAYIITTESMKPNINSGDVIIIKKIENDELNVEDVISFKKENIVITHRIIQIDKDSEGKNIYTTKGDNNNVADEEKIKHEEVEGKKVFRIPFFGKLVMVLQDEVYIILLIIVLLVIYLRAKEAEEKNQIRREKKEKEDEKYKNRKNN